MQIAGGEIQGFPYAHTLGSDPRDWEHLDTHLHGVATRAATFATAFDAAEIARLAGLWHDLGKYAPHFQQMLLDTAAGKPKARVDHSTAGALLAHAAFKSREACVALAFAIAGHHAGLADLGNPESIDDSCLVRRLLNPRPEALAARKEAPAALQQQTCPALPHWLKTSNSTQHPLRFSMFVRMVFSCLVDADRLATEEFADPGKHHERGYDTPAMARLRQALDRHLDAIRARSQQSSTVGNVREQLLKACREAAERDPGMFSLTAPTGSGKTLSSMAFALAHAEKYGMNRVIYALPFTSVTEQNAAVFRKVFDALGQRVVLEHHSAVQSAGDSSRTGKAKEADTADTPTGDERWRELAAENWDAPIVVTTNVRLLETLFASATSECRRLHRLAKSVILFDEAQTLPVDLLRPTLAAFEELCASYRTSIVLCTATMPALKHRRNFPIGLKSMYEIVPEPARMADAMRRVSTTHLGPQTDEQLAERIAGARRVLAIVNTRPHAARLYDLVRARAADVLHLSALMCPAHRSDRVSLIKQRLAAGADCRVVSTQVVEAGVDLDFEVVYRAMAGLDSIVQAAGRCNREGRQERGQMFTFDTDEPPPPGICDAVDAAKQALAAEDGNTPDPLAIDTIESYFKLLYWSRGGPHPQWDGPVDTSGARTEGGITSLLSPSRLGFRTASELYKVIDEYSVSVVVPYGEEGSELCRELLDPRVFERANPRELWRDAQRFAVSVRPWHLQRMADSGACAESPMGIAVVTEGGMQQMIYNDHVGLRLDSPTGGALLV